MACTLFFKLPTTGPKWNLCFKNSRVNQGKSHSTPHFPLRKVTAEPISPRPQATRPQHRSALHQTHSLPQWWQSSGSSCQSGRSVHIHLSCISLQHRTPSADKLQKTAASEGCSQNLAGKTTNFRHHSGLKLEVWFKKINWILSNWEVSVCSKSTRIKLRSD